MKTAPLLLPATLTQAALKERRLAAGLTQTSAGRLVGVSLRTWQRWEMGEGPIPAAALMLFQIQTEAAGSAHRTQDHSKARPRKGLP